MVALHRDYSKIKKIILHCSDSDLDEFDSVEAIRKWHLAKGWSDIGYAYFISRNGGIFPGRPLDQAGAHCSGHNIDSIGICLHGRKEFRDAQFVSTLNLIKMLMSRFKISKANIYPHSFFNPEKTCPNFELSKLWSYDTDAIS